MSNINRFYKAIEFKGWDDNVIGFCDDYNGATTDSQVIVVEGYGIKDWEKFEKFLEAVCDTDDNLDWAYSDQTYIDYDDNCAYTNDGYTESDVLLLGCNIVGRRQFENKESNFTDIAEEFINNSEKALPSWLDPTEGFEEMSCDFEDGWYGRNDDPNKIMAKAQEEGFDVVFQISFIQPFATGFCVWTREAE